MARLVFCFFAENTDIFNGNGRFNQTIDQMSDRDGTNNHEVLSEIFRAMNIKGADRTTAQPHLPNWANGFPYVSAEHILLAREVHFPATIADLYEAQKPCQTICATPTRKMMSC